MSRRIDLVFCCWVILSLGFVSATAAQDAPAGLSLRWQRQLPERKPAWQFTPKMGQESYDVAAAGRLAVVGLETSGAAIALDIVNGDEKWRYYTQGPIRAAAAMDDQRIFVPSDDGHLYCLDHSGQLLWKHRGGPTAQKVLGHERLISAWPITVPPTLADGKIFYVAGYWPHDGIFVHCLDAKSGAVIWTNSIVQTRPNGRPRVVDGRFMLEGFPSGVVLRVSDGGLTTEKTTKPDPLPPLATPGLEGGLTGRSQVGDAWVVTSRQAIAGFVSGGTSAPSLSTNKSAATKALLAANGNMPSNDALAQKILQATNITAGYCVVRGASDGALVAGLLKNSKLHVLAIEPDETVANQLRRRCDDAGLFHDHRLAILSGADSQQKPPPYFASLIISETGAALSDDWAAALRPYGGAAVQVTGSELKLTRRDGALKGAADWSQEFGDETNRLSSSDTLVKAPFGTLWYGGIAADPRYYFDGNVDHQSGDGLNPQPVPAEVVEGRMILQSVGRLAAFDVYTGRLLWESPLPKVYPFGGSGGGLGIHSKKHPRPFEFKPAFDTDVTPIERSRASGFDFASLADGIYIAAAEHLLRINPRDGQVISSWPIPLAEKELRWGGLRIAGDVVLATAFRPQDLVDAQAGFDGNGGDWAGDRMPMTQLMALDRHTGKLLWNRRAEWGFLNRSGIAAGGSKVFCVDLLSDGVMEKWREAGRKLSATQPALYALDLETGREVWKFPLDVFAKNIAYCAERDLLVVPNRHLTLWQNGEWQQAGDPKQKNWKQGPGRMRALRGGSGEVVWEVNDEPYNDPLVIVGDVLLDRQGTSFSLLTGKRHQRKSPLTGQDELWSFKKSGCNHLIACPNVVTWRTAAFDLGSQSGTMKFVGMDAGCSPTLIPANGVLNIPNFGTHHKRNRMTAMALVHRSDADHWTTYTVSTEKNSAAELAPVKRLGFNFGSPGDRVAEDGVLWLQVPGKDRAPVVVQPTDVTWFTGHASQTNSWIAASGVSGVTRIELPLVMSNNKKTPPLNEPLRYDVRLYFAEPNLTKPGDRVFSIHVEGGEVIRDLDVVKEAGGPHRPLIRELKNVTIEGSLDIDFRPKVGAAILSGVELLRKE